MSHRKKLEQALELLLQEDSDRATELLHQVIVEKARGIYESIVEEEDLESISDESVEEEDLDEAVGGEESADFTDEISSDMDDIDSDEINDGEAEETDDADDDHHDDVGGNDAVEDRIDDLEAELEALRAEFERIAGEASDDELEDMPVDDEDGMDDVEDMADADMADELYTTEEGYDPDVDEGMYEKKKDKKLPVAKQAKKELKAGHKRSDEETKFLNKVADTGQHGVAKLVGAGTHSKLGAEQTKSTFTSPPSKKDYGGKPVDFGKGTGGEYGKYHGESAKDDTPSDNVGETPKKSSVKADTTAKYTGGKAAGEGNTRAPLTKSPRD
jgi:hypothetical protein